MNKFMNWIVILLVMFAPIAVSAQVASQPVAESSDVGQTIIGRNNVMTILLLRDIQNPDSHQVTYRLVILPNITSDRAEIQWYVTGVSKSTNADDLKSKNIKLEAGKQITESFTVLPSFFGQAEKRLQAKTEIRVEVRSFHAGENYLVAARDNFNINQDLEVLGTDGKLPNDFAQAKQAVQLRNGVIVAIGAVVAILLAVIGYAKFQQWLARGK
jgi:hypothetical protein